MLRDLGATAVHTHSLDAMLYGGLAATLAGVPNRIHTQHNTQLRTYSLKDRSNSAWPRGCSRPLPPSRPKQHANLWRTVWTPPRCSLIANGIDTARFASAPAPPSGSPRIGCVARLSPEKGIDRLLEAFAGVLRQVPYARLAIAGDGPARGQLEARAHELTLGGAVEFLGYREDVSPVLGSLDLFVLPSLTEGIPLALLEAMAAGLPVIATAVGGVPEVVEDGTSGMLVPPGDAAALERAMLGPAGCAGRATGARQPRPPPHRARFQPRPDGSRLPRTLHP